MTRTGLQLRYYTVDGLASMAVAAPMGVLMLFLQARGLSLEQLGLVIAVTSASVVALEIPTGAMADTYGRRNTAGASYAITFIALALLMFTHGVGLALLYALLAGVGRAIDSGGLDAWFVDSLQETDPDLDLAPFMARQSIVETSALAFGALLGGLAPWFSARYGLHDPLVTALVTGLLFRLLALLALWLLVPNDAAERSSRPEAETERPGVLATLRRSWRVLQLDGRVGMLLVAMAGSGLAIGVVQAYWQPLLESTTELGRDNTPVFGGIQALGFVFGTVGGLSVTRFLALSRSPMLAAFTAQCLKAAALVGLALSAGVAALTVFIALFYLSIPLTFAPHMASYNTLVPAGQRSTLLSVSSLMMYIGAGLGGWLIGSLIAGLGFLPGLFATALVVLVTSLPYLFIHFNSKRDLIARTGEVE